MYSDFRIPWVCLWLWCSLADVLVGCPMRRGPLKPSQSFDAELCSVTRGLEIWHGKWVFLLRFALGLLTLRVRRLVTYDRWRRVGSIRGFGCVVVREGLSLLAVNGPSTDSPIRSEFVSFRFS